MKLGQMCSTPFFESLDKLMKLEGVPMVAQFKLRKVAKVIREQQAVFDELRTKLLKEVCELTPEGEPKLTPRDEKYSQLTFKEGCKKKYDDEYKKLCAIEVAIPVIDISLFGEAIKLLKPEDVFQLEFLELPGEAH